MLSTGGTIASRQSAAGGAQASDAGAALLERVEVPSGVTVQVRDLMTINSFVMTPNDMLSVVVGVQATLGDPTVAGVVVTHGTDTMEETALLVDLFHDDPRPVVFTGAQIAADQDGTDGPANLGDAIAVAAANEARDLGVLVVFGGAVLAARGTRKTATVAAAAFANPESGALGVVVDGRLRLQGRAPARVRLVPVGWVLPTDLPRVDIVALYPGADSVGLLALVDAGAQGIVLEATGAGNANPGLVETVRDLVRAGVTVVVSTRVHSGPVVALYGGGGGVDLVAAGAVLGGSLRPSQARVLLMALLGTGASRDQIERAFVSTARWPEAATRATPALTGTDSPAPSLPITRRTKIMTKDIICAFGVDVDAVAGWLGSYGGEDSPDDISRGMFAGEVGVPRLLELFRREELKTTWFVPGHSIETFPEQTEAIVAAGHEIGIHGYSHENPIAMSRQQETEVLDHSISLVEKVSGRRPTGYVAPWWEFSRVTNELLLERGIKYDHSLMHRDFEPYYVRVGDSWTPIDYSAPARTTG